MNRRGAELLVSAVEGSEEKEPGGPRGPAGWRAGGSGTYEYSRLTSGPVGAEPDPLLGAQLGPQAGGLQRTSRLGGWDPLLTVPGPALGRGRQQCQTPIALPASLNEPH